MDVVVFGAGSLGSLVGGLLAADHDVTLVGRDPHISAVQDGGLQLTGAFEREVTLKARYEPPADADLAIVTVKSFDTETAAATLAPVDLEVALSLQNGMGNEETLGDALSCPILAGTCTYGARLPEPGVIECTGLGDIVLGPHQGGTSTIADQVGDAFATSGFDVSVAADMPARLWEKLAVNAGINATTALARIPNGGLVDGAAGSVAAAAAKETARVAQAHGIDLPEAQAVDRTEAVAAATAANTSSMHQDVLAGKRTEIDAINGYVVAQASEPVPVNETLTSLVRAWERAEGLRPADG